MCRSLEGYFSSAALDNKPAVCVPFTLHMLRCRTSLKFQSYWLHWSCISTDLICSRSTSSLRRYRWQKSDMSVWKLTAGKTGYVRYIIQHDSFSHTLRTCTSAQAVQADTFTPAWWSCCVSLSCMYALEIQFKISFINPTSELHVSIYFSAKKIYQAGLPGRCWGFGVFRNSNYWRNEARGLMLIRRLSCSVYSQMKDSSTEARGGS